MQVMFTLWRTLYPLDPVSWHGMSGVGWDLYNPYFSTLFFYANKPT